MCLWMLRVTGSSSGMMLWCVISAVRDVCTFRKPWKYRQVGQENLEIVYIVSCLQMWISNILLLSYSQLVKQTLLLFEN